MTMRGTAVLAAMLVCLAGIAMAQADEAPLENWGAPPYWVPAPRPADAALRSRAATLGDGISGAGQTMTARAAALPSTPLPFVAVAPCRIVDTRAAVADGFHAPNFADDEARTFAFPDSPDCPGLPAAAGAYSVNIQFRPMTAPAYLTAYPTGTTRPGVSTMVGNPAGWTANAAVVPAGTGGGIDIYCQYAGRVIIDVNGYYAPQTAVTSLNTLTGDLSLAEGANVTITPSGSVLTVAATGGPGGELPLGSANQTLRSDGENWLASSALTNDGTNVAAAGNFLLPETTETTGQIWIGNFPFAHSYAGPGTDGYNTFVGELAGNFTMGGTDFWRGSNNTGIGFRSLLANTTGLANTGTGSWSLAATTSGFENTASGYLSLPSNTTGYDNTAVGSWCLYSTTTGHENTAIGDRAGWDNTTGSQNTLIGAYADVSSAGLYNATAIGYGAIVDAINHVRIGDTNVTQIGGQVAWSNLSDARAKTDVRDLDLGLDFVLALRPVAFTLKTGDGRTDMGFLAQDVEALLGHGYGVVGIGADAQRTLSLRYTDLIAPLVKAIQDQHAEIVGLRAQVATTKTLQASLATQQAQIEELRQRVEALLAANQAPRAADEIGN